MSYYIVPNESETVLSGLSLYYDSMYVSSGGTAADTTLTYGGSVYVSSGGTATETTLYYYGSMYVCSSGLADKTNVNGGTLIVSSSGLADNTTINTGVLEIYSGGTADNTTANLGGGLNISSGGTATNILENGGDVNVYSGATATFIPNVLNDLVASDSCYITIHSGTTAVNANLMNASMFVYSGGTATGTTIVNWGLLRVNNGLAENTVVDSRARIEVSSGGAAKNTTVSGGSINVYTGANADGVSIASGGYLFLYGGTATGVAAEDGAIFYVYLDSDTCLTGTSGGKEISISEGNLNGLEFCSSGYLYVSNYVTATSAVIGQGARMFIDSYGSAVDVVENGGNVILNGGNAARVTFKEHEFKDVVLEDSGSYNGTTATVHSGTTATNTTIGGSAVMCVYSGGSVNSATVSAIMISSGSSQYLRGGSMFVYSGGIVDGIIRACELGKVTISSDAVVADGLKLVEDGGGFELGDGIAATFQANAFGGRTLSGMVTVHSGTTATDIVISNGSFDLYEGGSAFNVNVGRFNSSYYSYDCPGVIHGGAVASGLSGYNLKIESGAVVYDLTGGAAIAGTVSRATVNSYGSATIQSGGRMVSATVCNTDGMGVGVYVLSGGTLEDSVIDGGYGEVSSGGVVNGLTVTSGSLYIYPGATIDNLNVSSGYLSIGGSVTNLRITENVYLWLRVDPTTGAFVSGTMGDSTPVLLKDGKFEHFETDSLGLGISSGGVADDITFKNGIIYVSTDGTATNFNVSSGGSVYVSTGGTLTGATFHGIKDSWGGYYSSAGAFLGIYGGEANSIKLEGGRVSMTSGTLQDVDVNGGYMWVYGGTVKNAVVSSGGSVVAENGAFENVKLADYGYMSMGYAATATGTVLSATQVIHSSGSDTWTENKYGYLYVYNGGVAVDTTIDNACELAAAYGGSASKTVVNSGGRLSLYEKASSYWYGWKGCGIADDVTVSSGGSIHIGLGASATNLKYEKGAQTRIELDSETLAVGTLAGSGAFEIKDGAVTADFPVLENGFQFTLYDGSVITVDQNAVISDGGGLYVNGGTVQGADVITLNPGGYMYYDYGVVEGKIRENGGYFYNYNYSSSGEIEFEQNTFTGVTLTFGQSATVHSGTVADGTTILVEHGSNNMSGYGANMQVFSGGIAKNTTVAGGGLFVNSGGTALNTLVNSYGHMELDYRGGASAINTTVAGGGVFYASGGSYGNPFVSETRVSSGGTFYLYAYNGSATADDTVVHSGGTFVLSGYDYGSLFANNTVVSSGGTFGIAADIGVATVSDTVVESGGVLYLDSPAVTILSGTVFKSGGSLAISEEYRYYSHDDAGFYDTLLESGASVTLHDSAVAFNTVLGENAVLELGSSGGASVVSADAAGATVRVLSSGAVESAFIGTGAVLDVRSGGWAYFTTIDGGTMRLNGIPGEDTYAYGYGIEVRNGTLSAGPGAYLGLVSAGSGGRIELGSGAIATEQILLSDDAVMSVDGGMVAFQLGYTPGPCILVDDISRITGTPDYRVVVRESDQAYGEYVIATGAAAFDSTITIIDRYDDPFSPGLGTLTLGGESVQVGDRWYSLMHPDDDAIAVVVTKRALSHDDGPDNGWNDYLYDKKKEKEGKPALNPNAVDFEANVLTSDVVKVNVDQMYTVYNKDSAGKLWYNFVGNGTVSGETRADAADFALIHLDYGARLSFDLEAMDATKFTVWSLTIGTDKKGNTTYTQKSKQATTLKKAKGATTYTAQTRNLFLEAGDYYVSMQSTNIKKGGAAFYNVKLNQDETQKNFTVFYSDGDDGWNNYLYDKKKTPALNPDRYDFPTTYVSSGTTNVRIDSATSHTDEESGVVYNNFVGFGDDTDFARVYLDYASSLSFSVTSTDAAKFTVWQLVIGTDKKGNTTYTQKNLQTTTLKKAKGATVYAADTKNLMLEKGYYYVSVQSTNAKKGGAAYYNVEVNQPACAYYADGDSGWNNWLYDKKRTYEPLNSSIYYSSPQTIGSGTTSVYVDDWSIGHREFDITWDSFVGFGDSADFRKIRLDSDAALSFTLQATDATKFTVWRLIEGTDKKGNTTYTQKALQATTLKKAKGATLYEAETKALLLEAGTYYVSMESTNAAKGGRAYYNVAVGDDSRFYVIEPASALAMPETAAAYADSAQDKLFSESGNGLLASL